MHHGMAVTAGHYTAQLVEAEGDILCDDNTCRLIRPATQLPGCSSQGRCTFWCVDGVEKRPMVGAQNCVVENTLLLARAGDGAGRTVRSGLSLDKWGGAKVGSSFALVLGCVLLTVYTHALQWPAFSSTN